MKTRITSTFGIQWLFYLLGFFFLEGTITKTTSKKSIIATSPVKLDECGQPCTNANFEAPGTAPIGWTASYGKDDAFASCTNPEPCNLTPGWDERPAAREQFDQHVIVTSGGYDPNLGGTLLPLVSPGNGRRSFRLGDLTANDVGVINGRYPAEASRVSMTYTVSEANANFTYQYAIVLEEPLVDHFDAERPYFQVRVRNAAGAVIPCGNYKVIAKQPFTDFKQVITRGGGAVDNHNMFLYYRDWTTVVIPLRDYIGQCVTIEFTSSDCSKGGHLGYAYIEADCATPLQIQSNVEPCTGRATLIAPAGAAKYQWSNNDGTTTGIVGPTNGQTINVNTSGTYKVIITSVAGNECTYTLIKDVVVTLSPGNIQRVPDIVVCNGTLINPINFTVNPAGATVQWKNTNTSIGLAANGTGNIAGFTVQNNTGQIQNAVVTAKTTNGSCPGDSIKFSIQVLPSVKTTTTRAKTTVCSGEFIPAVIFSNNQTVLWQNTNPAIGLAASGSGDMSGFTAVNSTTAPIQATVTFNITQSASCSEQTIIYPIEVKPNPTLSPLQDIEVCSGSPVAVSFQTSPSASQVKWTNSNPGIGLKPLNGTGNIASFTTTNYGTQTSISSTITAFSNLNGCPSDTVDIDITVHPFPNVDLGPDILVTQDTTITLTPDSLTSDVVSFKWTPGDNLSCTDCREPQLTVTRPDPFAPFTDSLVYNLEVTTANGCTREDQIAILIRYIPCAKGNIFIPTVFTPNGDGINDLFYIQGTGYGKVKQFLIFDRWGNKVFEKNNFIINDKTAGWNGVYKNQLVKTPATYVYYLTVECVAGQPQVIKGTISVLK